MRRFNNGRYMSKRETERQREARNKLAVYFFAITFVGGLIAIAFNMPPNYSFEVYNPLKQEAHAIDIPEKPWKEQVRDILTEYKINADEGEAIMICESSLIPTNTNQNKDGSWDKGVWMINDVHKVPDDVRLDPVSATYAMVRLYYEIGPDGKQRGWKPWVVYKSKCYYRELAKLTK